MSSVQFYNFWDNWLLYHKVIFDGVDRIIYVTDGVLELDVKNDIYSSWKEWIQTYDNYKWAQAFRAVGGDPTVGINSLGSTFFLVNGWKIQPWTGFYRLQVSGNLFSEDGSSPYLPATGNARVLIESTVSNIVSVVEPGVGQIAGSVWGADLSSYNTQGTAGRIVKDTSENAELAAIR
jgi:hypothetical protein